MAHAARMMFWAARPRSQSTERAWSGSGAGHDQGDGGARAGQVLGVDGHAGQTPQRLPVADGDEVPALRVLRRAGLACRVGDGPQLVLGEGLGSVVAGRPGRVRMAVMVSIA